MTVRNDMLNLAREAKKRLAHHGYPLLGSQG